MGHVRTVAVSAADGELSLDRWFKRHFPAIGHGRLEKLLRTGQVRVDGKRAKASDRVAPGMAVRVPPLGPEPETPSAAPRPVPRARDIEALLAAVLYRDEDVIAIDKPPGLAVQGGSGTERHLDMMLDALRFDAAERPRLVHRLDRDTSGVLLLARSAAAAAALGAAFRDKSARKIYWGVVVGAPRPRQGTIDMPLSKQAGPRGERVAFDDDDGKRAVTHYATIENAHKKAAWLALWPLTGRTHQLRVHCAVALGTPILGDGKYGGAAAQIAGVKHARMLHLHARSIALPHPRRGTLRVEAPLPPHMRETWRFFGFAESAADPFIGL
jgi:23S rRNA pseudouridine955/2504/2580 synthase